MNIAIWGMGVSGISALRYLRQNHKNNLYLVSEGEPSSWSRNDEILTLSSIDRCFDQRHISKLIDALEGQKIDQIILSPGISKNIEALKFFREYGCEIICEVELAARASNVPIIGITGTNGKTTTTTMIEQALLMSGKNVFVGGNIGTPFCDIFLSSEKFDYAVIELSSFQLELIESLHCHIAMILNISPSHMERYDSLSDYTEAKINICDRLSKEDFLLFPNSLKEDKRIKKSKANKKEIERLNGFDFSKSTLVGSHNEENFFCCYEVLKFLNIDDAEKVQQRLINEFKAVKYRLELCYQSTKLKVYNDSKSTNFASTLAAIKSFESDNLNIILGGKLRSEDFSIDSEFYHYHFQTIFTYGEAGELLKEKLKDKYVVYSFKNLNELMMFISKSDVRGNLIFSPAFPSFDLYPNYIKRGEDFESLTTNLLSI